MQALTIVIDSGREYKTKRVDICGLSTRISTLFIAIFEFVFEFRWIKAVLYPQPYSPRGSPYPRCWTGPRRCGRIRASAYRASTDLYRRRWRGGARHEAASSGRAGCVNDIPDAIINAHMSHVYSINAMLVLRSLLGFHVYTFYKMYIYFF